MIWVCTEIPINVPSVVKSDLAPVSSRFEPSVRHTCLGSQGTHLLDLGRLAAHIRVSRNRAHRSVKQF